MTESFEDTQPGVLNHLFRNALARNEGPGQSNHGAVKTLDDLRESGFFSRPKPRQKA
jgi:hypothetical protein